MIPDDAVFGRAGAVIPPVVTRERFAALVGVDLGVVTGWCNKGYLPCVSLGKYSLVNVALLQKRALEKEFG